MPNINDLETPAAIVDLDRFERNLDKAATYAAEHKLSLRPHVKTHKTPWIAAEQLKRGAGGVTCATPREAEEMSAVCSDLLIAYPPVGAGRSKRIASLPENIKVTVALDSSEAIDEIARAASAAGRRVGVYVEIDLGMHRVGVATAGDALSLARKVSEEK